MDLVVLSGLQGAGKTTFYRARFADGYAHVSRDLFRNNANPLRRQAALIEEAVAAGRPVVVDNTSPRRADREGLVAVARRLGLRPVLYWFPPDVKACIARNARREGKAKVPVPAILGTARRMEPPEPATEGFEEAFRVIARDEGRFDVEAWGSSG